MCGRFTLRTPPDAVASAAGLRLGPSPLQPRFNIAPSQSVLAFRAGEAVHLRWGLVPSWAKDPAIGSRMINARGETVAEKPSFRAAFRQRRCVVPADGFYEWRAVGKGKQPYFLRLKGDRPFAFAGLWERWQGADGTTLETCAIVTTTPNALAATIHDRMPLILGPEAIAPWIDPSTASAPFPADAMEAFPVSTRVNRPANDDPMLVAPLNAPLGLLL